MRKVGIIKHGEEALCFLKYSRKISLISTLLFMYKSDMGLEKTACFKKVLSSLELL